MEKFVFHDHVVDVLFESFGFSFEEALENAALAMFTVMADVEKVNKDEENVEVEEKAETLEELVGYTLADLLSELDSRELFFGEFKVSKFRQDNGVYEVKGVARGSPADPDLGRTFVKAVTYHEIAVKKSENGQWSIQVLLDI